MKNSKKLEMKHWRLKLLLLASLALSGCVTEKILDAHLCSIAGTLSAGGNCTHLLTSESNQLSFEEMLNFLSPQPERICVPIPGMNLCCLPSSLHDCKGDPVKLPARGAAIAISSDDFRAMKTEVSIMCRMLGKRCAYALLETE